jgi:hypothetical protein
LCDDERIGWRVFKGIKVKMEGVGIFAAKSLGPRRSTITRKLKEQMNNTQLA